MAVRRVHHVVMMKKQKGVVAAGHKVTAEAAAELLNEGGNAFDAVLAGLFAACVAEQVLASPGGGGHLMAHVARTGETVLYDFFVDTPRHRRPPQAVDFRSVFVDFGPARQEFHVGAGSVAVPGFVPGVLTVHEERCSLPLGRIIEPATRAARGGIRMTPFQSYLFSIVEPLLMPEAKQELFSSAEGKLLTTGDTLSNASLADTFEALAREGGRLFIDGEIGCAIIRQSLDMGGHLTRDDLSRYEVVRRKPLSQHYRGHEFFLNPAPAASGPLLAFGLALIERMAENDAVTPAMLARVMEATNEVRRVYGDQLSGLTNGDEIGSHLEAAFHHACAPRGTTHISVVDGDGNAAAATVSNGEGNGVLLGNFGFLLNNMLGEEDLNPGGFHKWTPGTRMSTMMAPTLVLGPEGSLTAMGSGGSNRIRSAILQVALQLIENEVALEKAVTAPRLHVEKCGTLSFEDQFPEDVRCVLVSEFQHAHAWPEPNMFFGGVHVVRKDAEGRLEGIGDPRRSGVSIVT